MGDDDYPVGFLNCEAVVVAQELAAVDLVFASTLPALRSSQFAKSAER